MIYFATALSLAATGAVAQTLTGQYSCATAGNYQLCQNLWGESAGTGSQTSTLISTSGNSISWETVWNWQNAPNSVKSYANVLSNTAKGVQLSHIASAPTSWSWTYKTESSGIRADVSYDLWLGTASSGTAATKASSYEIMIWLSGQGGIQPVGSQITTGISLAGHNWNLWSGPNSNWQVLSFVSQDGDITNFNADLNEFFQYIIAHNGVSPSQYVQAIQTGTEPFTGNADLLTNSYSVSINQGTPPTSTTSSASSSTTSSTGGTTVPKYGQCGGIGYTGSTVCAAGSTCTVSGPYYSQCL